MTKHKYFEKNEIGRDFVVGDLHGCYDILFKHLDELRFSYEKDRLFSVGDLVDRGDNSLDCLKLIYMPWFHAVRGNHEDMMLNVVLGDADPYLWVSNGGEWSNDVDLPELRSLCTEADKLPLSMTIETNNGRIGVCHAQPPLKRVDDGIIPWEHAQAPTLYDENIMLWGRDIVKRKILDEDYEVTVKGVDKVYCGHTVLLEPKTVGNIEFIDTGCVFKSQKFVGKLTVRQL